MRDYGISWVCFTYTIFTAEAKAIDLALDFISTCDANNKFIIFSDSLSVLKAMNHTKNLIFTSII